MLKRCFDAAFAAAVLLIGGPLFGLIALLIVCDSGLPVFYSQERVGRGFCRFRILKFRTMRMGGPGRRITVAGDPRVTRVGRILRAAKLDEVPQFWNVLKGEMSLVGPRPEIPDYVDMFVYRYRHILAIRPGITDLASIRFRNEELILARASDPMREYARAVLPAKLDLADEYLRTRSLRTDLGILVRTLGVTLHWIPPGAEDAGASPQSPGSKSLPCPE